MVDEKALLKGKKIYIFEDDDKLALNMSRYLSVYDYDVRYSTDAVQGLKAVKEFSPDLIITDINMPEVDGYTVFKEAQKSLGEVPVLVVTGEHKLQKLFEIEGVTAFIKKPFEMSVLETTVKEALLKHSPGK